MKAQRVFRMIAGALCLLVTLGLTAFCIGLLYAALFPEMSVAAHGLFEGLKDGFALVAGYWNMASVSYVIALLFYLTPSLLLTVGGVMLILSKRRATDIAGCVLALVGILPMAGFSAICAKELVGESSLSLIGVCFGVLSLFAIAVGCTLGLKPKKAAQPIVEQSEPQEHPQSELQQEQSEDAFADFEPTVTAFNTDEQPLPITTEQTPSEAEPAPEQSYISTPEPVYRPVSEPTWQPTTAANDQEAESQQYVNSSDGVEGEQNAEEPSETQPPHVEPRFDDSVENAMDSVYGQRDESPRNNHYEKPQRDNAKLTMLRTLLDSGLISQSEYDELVRSYS